MTLPSFLAASISCGVIAVAGGAAARTLAGVTSAPAAATADDALSTSRLDHVGFCIAFLLVAPGRFQAASSTECTATVRRHIEPHGSPLRDILSRSRHDADLRAVCRLDHVVAARTQEHLPRHCARHDVLRLFGLAGPEPYRMLADRHRAVAAWHQVAAGAPQRAPRKRQMALVERLALDHVA